MRKTSALRLRVSWRSNRILYPHTCPKHVRTVYAPLCQEHLGADAKIVPSVMAGLRDKIVLRQLKNRFPGGDPGPTVGGWYVRL